MRLAVAEVAFVRNLLPSAHFKSKAYSGTTMRYIAPSAEEAAGSAIAARLSATTEAALEALDKGYLRGLVLSIYSADDSPGGSELLESYVINVRCACGSRRAHQTARRRGALDPPLPSQTPPRRRPAAAAWR